MNKLKTFIPGMNLLYGHIEGLINKSQANVYWKSKQGKYLGANQYQLNRLGIDSFNELIGATDYDLSWSADAKTLVANDQRVISSRNMFITSESVSPLGTLQHYLSFKSPLLNQHGRIIGIYGLSYLLDDLLAGVTQLDEIAFIAGHQGVKIAKQFISEHRLLQLKLSTRQRECLTYLAKGMTIKQIGMTLSLSPRTVEHYIETIKQKLNCSTRFELIAKLHELKN